MGLAARVGTEGRGWESVNDRLIEHYLSLVPHRSRTGADAGTVPEQRMDWPSELVIDLGFGGLAVESVMPAWGFLVFVPLAVAVPMGPAEATAAMAGALAGPASAPQWLAILVVAAGMFAGDLLAYGAGGPITCRLRRHPRAANRLDRWRRRLESRPAWRDLAVIGLRFVPGARTPSALAARGAASVSSGSAS
ncbi:hypothetical protein GCM10029992_49360 [Glycomyces albus]